MTIQETSADVLRREARLLGRMIVRRDVEPEFIDRYIEAHHHLFTGPQPPRDLALVRFSVSRPLLLPCLDAAVAFVEADHLLRKKALLMAAILEASPTYADEFLPRTPGRVVLALLVARIGLTAAVHLGIGLPVLWILRRRA